MKTWEFCSFQRMKSVLKLLGEKQMFANESCKTIKSLKSALGCWHADHVPIPSMIKDQFFIHHKHC